jgi:hypothetical protein
VGSKDLLRNRLYILGGVAIVGQAMSTEPSEAERELLELIFSEVVPADAPKKVRDLLTRYASETRLNGLIEARRVLGTGQANFERWLALRITAERAAQQKAPEETK